MCNSLQNNENNVSDEKHFIAVKSQIQNVRDTVECQDQIRFESFNVDCQGQVMSERHSVNTDLNSIGWSILNKSSTVSHSGNQGQGSKSNEGQGHLSFAKNNPSHAHSQRPLAVEDQTNSVSHDKSTHQTENELFNSTNVSAYCHSLGQDHSHDQGHRIKDQFVQGQHWNQGQSLHNSLDKDERHLEGQGYCLVQGQTYRKQYAKMSNRGYGQSNHIPSLVTNRDAYPVRTNLSRNANNINVNKTNSQNDLSYSSSVNTNQGKLGNHPSNIAKNKTKLHQESGKTRDNYETQVTDLNSQNSPDTEVTDFCDYIRKRPKCFYVGGFRNSITENKIYRFVTGKGSK